MRVPDILELCIFAFARLGQCGQAEALADADSPHMTVLQSVLACFFFLELWSGVGDDGGEEAGTGRCSGAGFLGRGMLLQRRRGVARRCLSLPL